MTCASVLLEIMLSFSLKLTHNIIFTGQVLYHFELRKDSKYYLQNRNNSGHSFQNQLMLKLLQYQQTQTQGSKNWKGGRGQREDQ